MGGNAFQKLEVSRIHKDTLPFFVKMVVETLQLPNFTYEYAMNAMLGSCGKNETSGDVDFCMNTKQARFVGEKDYPVFNKYSLLEKLKAKLDKSQLNLETFSMGNVITCWEFNQKFYQVDFLFGGLEWMKFSHFSPGPASQFKGVHLTQLFGVMLKSKKDFERFDPNQITSTGEVRRVSRVGLHMGLELGVFRTWETQKKFNNPHVKVTADEFETREPNAPRFSRIGYVDNPEFLLYTLFGNGVAFEEVNSLEKSVEFMRKNFTEDEFNFFKEKYMLNLSAHKHMRLQEDLVKELFKWS